MYKGFVRTAAVTPELKVGDVEYNCERIIEYLKRLRKDRLML